ncbi:MAG: DUF3341 domain-containing protein [Phycisphaerae bacterium]|nr:DUF3341 domain-containing protein [Phycisphaerae bacterium]MDW8263252.1 DUF3341 domain-containing protein [Phycisphaerales bacterium]
MTTAELVEREFTHNSADEEVEPPPKLALIMAEFENVDLVLNAARAVRDAGFTKWDVHAPFPIHGIDSAMGTRMTVLPWVVLCGGLTGFFGGLLLTWWSNASHVPTPFMPNLQGYQFFVSGKPVWSLPANIPVIFETTVLFSALTAVFAMLIMNKLPMFYNPLFASERFRRVTDDRFFVVIDARDPKFEEQAVISLFQSLKPLSIEKVED